MPTINEILNTIRLQRQGLLASYQSPSAKPYPDWTKGKDHAWQAFAGRARVLIVNTKLLAADKHPKSLLDLTHADYRDRVVMAKPQFGTTATQAACLFEVLGEPKAFLTSAVRPSAISTAAATGTDHRTRCATTSIAGMCPTSLRNSGRKPHSP